jgi:hypothetical protein
VKHGSKYALFDGKAAYVLSDQKAPEKSASQKVKITGTLYEVASISADDHAGSSHAADHQH